MSALSFDILGRDKASAAFDKVSKSADRTEKKFGFLAARSHGLTAGMTAGFGKIAGAMAAVATVSVFKGFIDEARESRKVSALTQAIIKSTGGAAKVSAGQVGALATAISNKTGVDDEAIQSGSNLLLTFKNVRNEVGKGAKIFDRATAAAVDLSAAGFGDVAGASKMLGKALNDPIKGISALGRAGVTFTADQKKQIATLVETGDVLGAQKIILKEVESQVGGAAAAAADPMAKLGVIIGNVKETIGTAFLPIVDKAATWLGDKLPGAVDKAGKFFSNNLLPPLKVVAGFVTDKVIPVVGEIVDTFTGLGKKIVKAIGPVDVAAIGKKIFDEATGWASDLIDGFKTGVTSGDWKPLGKAIGDGLTAAIDGIVTVKGKILDGIGKLIDGVDWGKLGGKISTSFLGLIHSIDWGKLGGALGDALISTLQQSKDLGKKIGTAFKLFMDSVDWEKVGHDSTNAIGRFIQGIDWGQLAKTLGIAVLGSLKISKEVYDAVISSAVDLALGMGKAIIAEMGKFRPWLIAKTKELGGWLWSGLKSGLAAGAKGIGGFIKSVVVDPIVNWAKSLFGIHSPSTVFAGIGVQLIAGLKAGIAAAARGIGSWIYRTVIAPVVAPFAKAGTWLVQHGRNLVTGLKTGISAVAGSIGRWTYDHVAAPIGRTFTRSGTWLTGAGRDIIGGLTGGIAAQMKGIGSWIKGAVVDPIVKSVKNFFGIKSPSKVFAGIGGHLISGLMQGLSTTSGTQIAKKIFGDMPSALRSIVGKGLISVSNLPSKAMNALGSAIGIGQPIGGPAGKNQSNEGVVRTLAAQYGWGGGAQWNALRSLIMGESGFNNNAQNPTSSAYGLFQFLDSTWGSVGASKTSDPWQQTVAGLRYIARSYGSPANAYGKWSSRSPHWYKQGTPWVPNDQLAHLHKGEAVIPAEVNKQRLMAGGSSRQPTADEIGKAVAKYMSGVKLRIESRGGQVYGLLTTNG